MKYFFIIGLALVFLTGYLLFPVTYRITILNDASTARCNESRYFYNRCDQITRMKNGQTIEIKEPRAAALWNKVEMSRSYAKNELAVE